MARSAGKYFPETLNGQTFIGSTAAAGTAYPISTGTAATFGLWNVSPGTLAVLQRLTGAYTSGTIAFVCGQREMVEGVVKALQARGLAPGAIHQNF